MEIILLEKVQNLGDLGDLVKVRPGYARNYLIPQGKATFATDENKTAFEQQRKEFEVAASQRLDAANLRARQMENLVIEISRKAGEEGKLFGSVSTIDIADAVVARGIALEKSEINLDEGALKTLGEHEVVISLHPEVHFNIRIIVASEE
jgi:large subunit ribosomal protein L9